MFKRENRLVPGVRFNNSHFYINPQFTLKEKTNGLNVNRFGIVVSKKVDKRAVVRNKIKRFFRDALIGLEKKINTKHDILIIAKKGILDKNKEENLRTLEEVLIKIKLIQK
jgi:ribonuclease P protein component